MTATPKERVTELAKQLREASGSDPLARTAIELIKVQRDALIESLVELRGEELFRAQGAASEFRRLHKELTRSPAQGER